MMVVNTNMPLNLRRDSHMGRQSAMALSGARSLSGLDDFSNAGVSDREPPPRPSPKRTSDRRDSVDGLSSPDGGDSSTWRRAPADLTAFESPRDLFQEQLRESIFETVARRKPIFPRGTHVMVRDRSGTAREGVVEDDSLLGTRSVKLADGRVVTAAPAELEPSARALAAVEASERDLDMAAVRIQTLVHLRNACRRAREKKAEKERTMYLELLGANRGRDRTRRHSLNLHHARVTHCNSTAEEGDIIFGGKDVATADAKRGRRAGASKHDAAHSSTTDPAMDITIPPSPRTAARQSLSLDRRKPRR